MTESNGAKVFISSDRIVAAVRDIAASVMDAYRDRQQDLVVVGLLKGSFIFMADLVRAIDLPLRVDFMVVSSYGDGATSEGVKIVMDMSEPVAGRDVLLVEDIIDTGRTLAEVLGILRSRGPASLKVCTLLDKSSRREVDIPIDFKGIDIPDEFVHGYGLDLAQLGRNLPGIYTIPGANRR